DLVRLQRVDVGGFGVPLEDRVDVAVAGVGCDEQRRDVGKSTLPAGRHVRRSGGQSGEDRMPAQQVDAAGERVAECQPVDDVVAVVVDVAERDRAADACDDHVRVGQVVAAEGHAAERLHADECDRYAELGQGGGQPARGGARAHAADQGQGSAAELGPDHLGNHAVAEV